MFDQFDHLCIACHPAFCHTCLESHTPMRSDGDAVECAHRTMRKDQMLGRMLDGVDQTDQAFHIAFHHMNLFLIST